MRDRLRRAAVVVPWCAVFAWALQVGTPSAAAVQVPFLTGPATAAPGATIAVNGFGFQPNSQVSLAVCGDNGLEGSSGCDLSEQTALITGGKGIFTAELRVSTPPVPCPCAVVAETAAGDVKFPLSINGAPAAPPDAAATSAPTTTVSLHTKISGGEGWKTWFGIAGQRSLIVTVSDTGPTPVPSSPLTVEVATTPGGTVDLPPATIPSLQPGHSTGVRLSIPIGVLSVGTVKVRSQLFAFNDTVGSRAQTFQMPWGLVAICAGGLQIVLLRLRNRIRRRLDRGRTTKDRAAAEPQEAPVIDLTESTPAAAG